MKRNFLDDPEAWTRAARQQRDPVRYASPIERSTPKSDLRTTLDEWLLLLIGALVLVGIFGGVI